MTVNNMKNKSAPMFVLLLTALAFNLSSLPGAGSTEVGSVNLSSVDSCDLTRSLESSEEPSAECRINDGTVAGTANLKRETRTVRDWSNEKDGKPETKEVTEWVLSVDVKTEGIGDCVECSRRTAKTTITDLREANNVAKRLFTEKAAELKKVAAAEKDKKERRERCEIDEKGNEYSDDTKVLGCKVTRLKSIRNREEAAKYFDTEIQPALVSMISCDASNSLGVMASMVGSNVPGYANANKQCESQHQEADKILQQLAKTRNNPYLTRAVMDLGQFSLYSKQIQTLNKAAQLPAGHPQRALAAKALTDLKSRWGLYFQGRYGISDSPMAWENSTFNFIQGLNGDRDLYQSSLNQLTQNHANLLQASGAQVAQNSPVTPMSAGNGRLGPGVSNLPGQVSTSLPGASGVQPFRGAAPMPNRPGVGPMNNRGTPNFIKPRLGAPAPTRR